MKPGAIGPNIPNARVENEMFICKKGFVMFDTVFYEYEGYNFKKGIVVDIKTGGTIDVCFWYDTIYIDKDDFFTYFMTKAEWREKQINSILE